MSEVIVTPETLDLYKGASADLTAKVLPLTASDRTVTWSSSDTSIATVDEFGRVTAVAKGTATIRATANGDPTKYAECTVRVEAINKKLNAFVWDENGKVWASSFNANNLPTWTKTVNNEIGTYLTSAFMFNASSLYAATLDTNAGVSMLYSVNRSTYALTEFSENFVMAFGLSRGPTGYQSQGYNFMVYGFARYLIMGNLDPDHEDPDDSSSAMYSGLPYGLLDLTETSVGDAYVCAIAAQNVGTTSCGYYFLDETGKIWQTTLSYRSGSGFVFSNPTLVVDTGIGTSVLYQSLYYDGTYLYWTHTTDNDCQLIIIVPSTGTTGPVKVYNAGNFGEDIWPVAGVYVDGIAAPGTTGANNVGDETEGEVEIEPLELRPVATREQLLTEDVIERMTALGFQFAWLLNDTDEEPIEEEPIEEPAPAEEPIEEPAPSEEPIEEPVPTEEPVEEPAPAEGDESNAYTGSLMVFRGSYAPVMVPVADPETAVVEPDEGDEPSDLILEVYEDEESHNGLIALAYDPDALVFASYEANEDITLTSVHVDEEKGVITVGYANKGNNESPVFQVRGSSDEGDDYIDHSAPIVTIHFTVSCEDAACEIMTLERNDEFALAESDLFDVSGTGHDWGEPTWTWAGDYSSATAAFVCANDESHTRTLEAEITSKVVGYERVITATVELDGETYTDVKRVPIPVTVSFDAGEGTVDPATMDITAGAAIGELPEPTREGGWVFMGWYMAPAADAFRICQGTEVTAETSFSENTTVYAHWRLPGDVNGDGNVDGTDVTLLATYVKAGGLNVRIVPYSGDVSGDGNVDGTDVTLLATFVKANGQGVVIH